MTAVNHWLSQQASYSQPRWASQRPATPPSFYLRSPGDADLDAVTWTRATVKSCEDWQGNVHQILSGEVPWQGWRRVYNLASKSHRLASFSVARAAWSGTSTLGGETVDVLVEDSTAGASHEANTSINTFSGGKYWVQFTAKRVSGTRNLRCVLYGGSGTYSFAVSLADGSILIQSAEITDASVSVSGDEVTCKVLYPADAASMSVYFGLMSGSSTSYNGDGTSSVAIGLFQVERAVPGQTAPSELVSVGVLSTPYHGAKVDGVRYFNTDDQGRLIDGTRGYDRDGTGAWVESSSVTPIAQGLLLGSAQTNRITYSTPVTGWTPTGAAATVAAYDAQVGSYASVTGLAAAGANDLSIAASGFTGNARIEVALMLRAVTTSGLLRVRHQSSTANGSWDVNLALVSTTRFERIDRFHPAVTINTEFTATAGGAGGVMLARGDSGSGYAIHVALVTQVEAERVQSLIYSAGSVTAKNADAPTFTAQPGYMTRNAGTLLLDFTPLAETAITGYYVNNRVYKIGADNQLRSYDGTTLANFGNQVERAPTVIVQNWSTGVGRDGYRDGVSQYSATAYDGYFDSDSVTLGGPMLLRELSLYPTALTATQLQALSNG